MTGRLARNIVAHYAGLFLMGIANLFIVRLLLNLGHEAYGIFALGASIAGVLQMFEVGVAGATVKYIAEWKSQGRMDRLQALWNTGQILLFGLGSVGAIIQFIIAKNAADWFHISTELASASVLVIYWFGISLLWHLPAMIAKSFLEGSQRYDLSNAADMAMTLLNAALLIIVLQRGSGITTAAFIQSISYLFYYVILLFMVRIELPQLKFGFRKQNWAILHEIRDWSFWNMIRNLASRLSWDLDSFIIGIFLSARSVSPYVVGRKFPYIFSAISWRWVEVFLPLSAHLQAEGKNTELTSIFLKASRFCLALSICGAIPLILFAEPMLQVWLGEVPAESVLIQQLVTLSLVLDLSHAVSATLLAGVGQIKRLSINFLIESVFNLGLTISLVPIMGIAGAAIATLISSTIAVLLLQIPFGCRIFSVSGTRYFREILRPQIIPTAASVAFAFIITQSLKVSPWPTILIGFPCAILAFGGFFWFTGLTALERSDARQTVQKLLC